MDLNHTTPPATYLAANAWTVYAYRVSRFLRFGRNRPDLDKRTR